jgi:hypothetical protein
MSKICCIFAALKNRQKCKVTVLLTYLLYHVCCDPNVVKYYEPNDFKNTISWKNPLFKGINANDSKDLINFMLEEMNQELCHLTHKLNDNNQRNNIQINQIDK